MTVCSIAAAGPSPKRAPVAEFQRLLAVYREPPPGFSARHFHRSARRAHGLPFCYGIAAGREPRPCFGELLHRDGSRCRWLALVTEQGFTLLIIACDQGPAVVSKNAMGG